MANTDPAAIRRLPGYSRPDDSLTASMARLLDELATVRAERDHARRHAHRLEQRIDALRLHLDRCRADCHRLATLARPPRPKQRGDDHRQLTLHLHPCGE